MILHRSEKQNRQRGLFIPKYTRRENSFPEGLNWVKSDNQWILSGNYLGNFKGKCHDNNSESFLSHYKIVVYDCHMPFNKLIGSITLKILFSDSLHTIVSLGNTLLMLSNLFSTFFFFW